MKRRTFVQEYFGRIALTFLLLCLIVYTVYHALGNASDVQTTPARQITDTELIGGEAWLFRDESLLTVPQAGLVNSVAKSGSKVGKNTPLTEIWVGTPTGELGQKQDELDRINRVIAVLEDSLLPVGASVASAGTYRTDAMNDLMKIRYAIREGNWSMLSVLEDDMLTNLNRYGALTGSEGAVEQALEAAKRDRQSLLSGTKTTLSNNESSAYYYDLSAVDGYETLFTETALRGMTAERFAELKASSPSLPEDACVAGKLCYGYSWHLAVEFPDGAGEFFEEDSLYSFRFPESDGMELELTCERIISGAAGNTVVVFRSDVTPSAFRYLRRQNVEITVGSNKGYYVPERAVTMLNGTRGVYIFEESTVRFRRIHVIYEGDGYFIVSRNDDDPENEFAYLELNDLIVTAGNNLYDGKVYQ